MSRRPQTFASQRFTNGRFRGCSVYLEAFTHSGLNASRVSFLIPEGDRLLRTRMHTSITTPAPINFSLSPIESKPFCWPSRLFSTGQACEWSSAKGVRGARLQLWAHFKTCRDTIVNLLAGSNSLLFACKWWRVGGPQKLNAGCKQAC